MSANIEKVLKSAFAEMQSNGGNATPPVPSEPKRQRLDAVDRMDVEPQPQPPPASRPAAAEVPIGVIDEVRGR